MALPFTIDEFIMYFNIGVLAIIAFFALIGFFRGTYKSIYYLIATVIVLGGGWFIADKVCEILLDYDASSFNLSFPVSLGDGESRVYTLTTVRELITSVVKDMLFGGTLPEDSIALDAVFAFTVMLLKIVYFIALIILSFTVLKLLFDIIWFIIKPRRRDKNGKKIKKSFLSRIGGMGVGAVKGLIYTLLICFIFAGVTSIISSFNTLKEEADTTETYSVVIVDDTATLIRLSENDSNPASMLDDYSEILNLIGAYKQTIAGQIFGSIKIEEDSVDELLFDQLFTLKFEKDDQKYDVKLRKELQHVATTVAKIPGLLTGEFSMQSISTMDKDVLIEVIDQLTSLEIVNVVIPVGIEIVLANEKILSDIEDENLRSVIRNSLSEMKGLDYSAEFKELGYVFVDVLQILEFTEDGGIGEMDYLSFDPDTIEEMFEKIGRLGLIDKVAPIFIEYLCSLDTIKEAFENVNIDIEELLHPESSDPDAEPISWSSEISNIGKVYKAFAGLGIKTEDFEEMNFEFTDENIAATDALVNAIFDSKIISNAIPVLVDLGKSKMPEDYANLITIPDEVDWANELKPLLKSALVLFSSGLFEEEGEMTDKLSALTDEKIDQLALYFSQSSIIKENLNGLIDKFLAPAEGEEQGILGDITIVSLDSADDWTNLEISSIFKAVKAIIDSDLIGSEDPFEAFSALDDSKVTTLAEHLSNSKFIKKNLSNILSTLLEQMSENGEFSLTIVSLEENEWTKVELQSIFLSLKSIAGSGIMNSEGTDGIKELSDDVIDNLGTNISQSKFLTRNLTEIMNMLLSSIELGDDIEIKGFENPEDWTKLEIVSLLKAARLVVNYTDDLTSLINLSEDNIDILLGSRLINDTLVSFIKAYTQEGKQLEIVKGVDMVADNEWQDVNTKTNININGNTLTYDSVSGADKYYIYLNSNKIGSTKALTFDLTGIEGVSGNEENIEVYGKKYGEIRKLFVAIKTLVGDDFNSETLSDDVVKFLTELTDEKILTVIDSKLISETIICKIEEFAEGEGAFISIPEGDLTKIVDGVKDRSAWIERGNEENGELFKLLRAIAVLFAGKDIGSSEFEFSTDLLTSIDDSDISKITESRVINETLIKKVEEIANETDSAIAIPTELLSAPTTIDREKWMDAKETNNLLTAFKTVFSGSSLDTSNLKIKPIIDGKDSILKSLVICETIKAQITKVSTGITVPSELSTDTLDGWKNTYDENGDVTSRGELSALLEAISIILTVDDDTNIDEISTDNLKLNTIISRKDDILKSLVITGTVKDKITSFEGIVIPEDEGLSTTNLIGWKNTYDENGDVASRGEISVLLDAVKIVLNIDENTSLDENLGTDTIKLNNVITRQDDILLSKVITATIKDKIVSSASTSGIIVPAGEGLSTTNLTGWKNTYNANGTVNTRGEIAKLLNSVEIILDINESTTLDNFSTDSIKLGNIVSNTDDILKSIIITATIKDKIVTSATSGIIIPEGEGLAEDTLIGWKNTYNESGTVLTRGEISNLFNSVDIVLDINESTTLDNFNTDSIKLGNVVEQKDDILKSVIITATIKDKIVSSSTSGIIIPAGEDLPLEQSVITNWKNTYDGSGNVVTRGEISALLGAIDIILDINESTTLDNFNTDSINLNNVINNKDNILKSLVITATIKDKIVTSATSGIVVPTGEGLSTTDLTGWKNTYNANGSILTRGEISALLNSVDIVLDINESTTLDNFNTDSIKLGSVIENQDEILFSKVITATIKDKIVSSATSGIVVPNGEGLSTTDLTGWKNTYNANGTVLTRGEISALLNSVDIVLDINESTTLDNFNTDSIKLGNVIENQDDILKSIIITATIKDKLTSIESIKVPNDSRLSTTNLTGWKNTYSANGSILTRGEISRLLNAVDTVLDINEDTQIDSFSVDSIKLGNVVYEKDEILKSLIISNTIRVQIVDNNTLVKPSTLSLTGLEGWESSYNDDYSEVEEYGELARLLTAIKYALDIDQNDNSSFGDINVDSITINNLSENRKSILRSEVISATIQNQISNIAGEGTGTLRLPAGYANELSPNYIDWENTYTDTTYNNVTKEFNFNVTSVGEIDKLLAAIGSLCASDDVTFSNITLEYSSLFDASTQAKLIASKLISETIIERIAENGVSIPNDPTLMLNNNANRTAWWSDNGELKYFLNAIGLILTDEQKSSLSVDLSVSTAYSLITNEVTRTELFKSYLITETLTVNFAGLNLFNGKLPSYANSGIDLQAKNADDSDNRSAWYVINEGSSSRSIEHKELWNLISSIHILLGDEFDIEVEFSIDQVLDNPILVPTLDANEVNTNDSVATLLASKIIEETFVDVVKALVEGDGILAPYLNLPVSPNWYLYTTSSGQEYDTRTIIESVYQMNSAGLNYRTVSTIASASSETAAMTAIATINSLNLDKLADAFVISRTFNGSIQKFFNGMLSPIYNVAYLYALYRGNPITAWTNVQIVQSDYAGKTRVEASSLLASNIGIIKTNIQTALAS